MDLKVKPAYLRFLDIAALEQRSKEAQTQLEACSLCPWHCRANRLGGKLGTCLTGPLARVACFGPHHGEETCLSGTRGSGTVFFSRCNLRCVFCQNHAISQADTGLETTAEELARIFLQLQDQGCHNINLVSPSHVVPQILAALVIAVRAGLRLPLVYNSGGYDSLEALALMDGVVDIYLPDMKFGDAALARKYCGARDYPAVNQAAVREMHRQVGNLILDADGIAVRGLIVRHLILPGSQSGTRKIAAFLSREISPEVYFNLMNQYYPAHRAAAFPILNRVITPAELRRAQVEAAEAGLSPANA
jgi:putative pyruvate formate lyase activating enzyme